jgi:hypothetical protein
MFGHDWVDGEATIVDRTVTKTHLRSTGSTYSDHKYVADVRVPGAPEFRTVIADPKIPVDWAQPYAGQVVRVQVDLKKQKARFDKDDPQLSAKAKADAYKDSNEARFQAAATATPGGGPIDPEMAELQLLEESEAKSAPAEDDPQARLQRLQQLKDSGMITDAEFAAKRQAIVDAL